MKTVCQWMALFLVLLSAVVAAEDPLRPEKAFRYSASGNSADILISWNIEPGYYLYKKKMSFKSSDPGVKFGKPVFPVAQEHEDEFFGKSDIYRGNADIRIPWSGKANGPLTVIIKSQGCADMGLCYPPQTWQATVTLPAAMVRSTGVPDFIKQSGSQMGGAPLPGEEAFVVSVDTDDPFTAKIFWDIADGYYIYRDQIQVRVLNNDIQGGGLQLPAGTEVDDLEYGLTQVYYGSVEASLPLSRATPVAQLLELELEFQGCKEDSICYPPQTSVLTLELPVASSDDLMRALNTTDTTDTQAALPETEQSRLARLIGSDSLLTVMLTFAGLGLLLAFTPCVLPMVPILSGIIAGQGENITSLRAFLLSLTYVLGMALTYTAAGVFFAAAGGQIQALLQQPWIIVGVALLFAVLAAAMFGAYNLQLPAALQTRLNTFSSQQQAGTFIGTAVMGALSALVVTTCVAPPLVAALTVIAEDGDVLRGGASLFALSIGMGLPLLVIGTSAGRLIPKAGAWMNTVKELFGFMMLGLAIWMLERILPGSVTLSLWAVLAVATGARLFMQAGKLGSAIGKLAAGVAAAALITYGLLLAAAVTQGGSNALKPLYAFSAEEHLELEFRLIKSVDDLDRELAQAAAEGRHTMLDFYADWCVSCKEMEHYTFSTAQVQAALDGFVLLQADVTANDAEDQALLQRMGIFGPPTIIFFDRNGREIEGQRVIGFQSADVFTEHVQRISN